MAVSIRKPRTAIFLKRLVGRVESMGAITLRTSQLDPNVRLSPHSAPDILED
ncbi:hypothetical protein [Nostoc sp. FACHB-888]|uniref:hypothetical protein n=1 Tax=Nostoc sp. FACHB-888 TaxID=2692842 RepID=UPI0016830026|nr:hypothetical protein [Nostoc sp. FACHB-888]MBD2249239.1 hypothetical protein [Nostoc sp. FACHB-888]